MQVAINLIYLIDRETDENPSPPLPPMNPPPPPPLFTAKEGAVARALEEEGSRALLQLPSPLIRWRHRRPRPSRRLGSCRRPRSRRTCRPQQPPLRLPLHPRPQVTGDAVYTESAYGQPDAVSIIVSAASPPPAASASPIPLPPRRCPNTPRPPRERGR